MTKITEVSQVQLEGGKYSDETPTMRALRNEKAVKRFKARFEHPLEYVENLLATAQAEPGQVPAYAADPELVKVQDRVEPAPGFKIPAPPVNLEKRVERVVARVVKCRVEGCAWDAQHLGLLCATCWVRLDEGVQRALPYVLNRISLKSLPQTVQIEAEEVRDQVLAQLAAVRLGGLGRVQGEDLREANRLTAKYHAFGLFCELVEAAGGYRPKFDLSRVSRFGAKDQATREDLRRLCDLYDREQSARNDPRRAVRLGVCGI